MDVLAGGKAGAKRAAEQARVRQGPPHPRDEDLPLSRPLHERPGQVPDRATRCDEVRKNRDPIDHVQELLAKKGRRRARPSLKAIDAEVKKIVADAAEFARTAPEPDPSELYTDVYLVGRPRDRHP